MADIRINALATTAASTASDDFIAVDGSANGTRKLNAFSPTFGGNLTVSGTGTSSVAGTLNVSGGFILNRINAKGIYTGTSDNCGFTWTGTNGEFSTASGSLILKSAGTTALTLDSSQNAIFAGSTGVQLKNDSFLYFGSTVRTAVKGNSTGSLELYANNNLSLTLDSSQNATFAGIITTQSSGTGSGLVIKRNANPYVDFYDGGTSGTIRAEILADNDGVSGGNFKIQTRNNAGTMTLAATFDKAQNATLAGSITTSAPTGGAGAWELGVANTVSPTAPNRTITIEIGGTVYYLHAKTTND